MPSGRVVIGGIEEERRFGLDPLSDHHQKEIISQTQTKFEEENRKCPKQGLSLEMNTQLSIFIQRR